MAPRLAEAAEAFIFSKRAQKSNHRRRLSINQPSGQYGERPLMMLMSAMIMHDRGFAQHERGHYASPARRSSCRWRVTFIAHTSIAGSRARSGLERMPPASSLLRECASSAANGGLA